MGSGSFSMGIPIERTAREWKTASEAVFIPYALPSVVPANFELLLVFSPNESFRQCDSKRSSQRVRYKIASFQNALFRFRRLLQTSIAAVLKKKRGASMPADRDRMHRSPVLAHSERESRAAY